ncbi:hypothetical protein EST38_g3685 [Candolleomyces aberdarensis]|uniref:Cytochrome P450 n=1 Tax=Candolleomyces aberdarensis TaxID=2316362 RepID=A0A4Q2DRG7_9AGAR|nr:hypothetical protein EST38_g3685 [Candolleomyces aberdarensis]
MDYGYSLQIELLLWSALARWWRGTITGYLSDRLSPDSEEDGNRVVTQFNASLAVVSLVYGLSKRLKRSKLPLPPGPKGAPLIGNLFQLPTGFEWIQYHEWCKEHNTDILYLNMAGNVMIVLDTSKVAIDLLETRSSLYSGRPYLTMITDLMKCDWHIGILTYGVFNTCSCISSHVMFTYTSHLLRHSLVFTRSCPHMMLRLISHNRRNHRRVMHHTFHSGAVKQFRPYIIKATRNLLKRLLDDPDPLNIISHIRHMAGDTILSIAYGLEIQQENDPYLKRSEAVVNALGSAGVPGAFLVDALPILKYVPAWFPGASFKRKAREWRETIRETLEIPFAEVKKATESGKYKISVVSASLQKIEEGTKDEAFTEEIIQNTAGSLFTAGSDTTVSAIASCILGLLEYPEVLKKAQAQIDTVVKPGHLPEFEDEPSLPYITAIVNETLRWRDVVPISEDEYRGYRLPAGAIIIPNAWAMLHDETTYPDPFTFNPDRFINPETGQIDYTHARDPSYVCWGFGRRACPGRYMAFSALWLAIASLIAVFDIEKAKEKVKVVGEDGIEREEERTVELTHEYASSIVVTPKPFKCVIKPRSGEKENLILRALLLFN